MSLNDFVENKINHYADRIIAGNSRVDEHCLGEMYFYMALRRVLDKKPTLQDIGMMDAINDTLQELGIIDNSVTFYSAEK